MKKLIMFLVISLAFAGTASATLLGNQVNGTLNFSNNPNNYFDTIHGFTLAGYNNNNAGSATITIDSNPDFGFNDGYNIDTADFTATGLLISDNMLGSGALNWEMTFTSLTPGLFSSLSLVSQNFIPGLTYSLTGDTITVDWAGNSGLNNFNAEFAIGNSAPVPEPGTMMLLGIGMAGLALYGKRRLQNKA